MKIIMDERSQDKKSATITVALLFEKESGAITQQRLLPLFLPSEPPR
jgi:hypothetical protein